MSSRSDWDEIRRLAADLQRAQLSSTIQRLSERNCIEIVNKVVKLGLLDVVFTSDGKEYVTPDQISREIKDELIVNGGRINLVDLTNVLNLDFNHIEAKAHELVKREKSLTLVLGQLISKDYANRIAEEINEKLQQSGQVTLGELVKSYDLPTEYLQELIEKRLGTIIHARTDPYDNRIFFTQLFVNRHKARVLGALSAITKPTPVLNIINHHNFQERIFHNVASELINSGELAGSISGGRQESAIYIPAIHSKAQNDWVNNFYRQNGYLEYDALNRLGISAPAAFIKKSFKNENLTYLSSCAVGNALVDQIDAAVDEALMNSSWTDITLNMPSICTADDNKQLLTQILKNRSSKNFTGHIFEDTIVCSETFIQNIIKIFDPIMIQRAEKDAQAGTKLNAKDVKGEGDSRKDKKEDRRKKAAGGKSGGGTQGRETKTKAVKKKKNRGRESDESDEESQIPTNKMKEIEFLSCPQIVEHLEKNKLTEDCPPELLEAIALHIHRPLRKSYQSVVQSVFLSSASATGTARRKTHNELQEKVNGLLCNIRLFEKGIKLFSGDLETQLSRHLLRTLGTDVVNLIFTYIAKENMFALEEEQISNEIRVKILSNIPEEIKDPLSKLNSSLNGKSVDDFISAVEIAAGPNVSDLAIKKIDKKKERQVSFTHRQCLAEQLSSCSDCALCLHLCSLVLFQTFTQTMLHASGKFVPQILNFLRPNLNPETAEFLDSYQALVIKLLTVGDDEEQVQKVKTQLEEMLPKVKEIALTTKKTSQSE